MILWISAALIGLLGAVVDVFLYRWSKTFALSWWCYSAVLILVFITSLGYLMRIAPARGFSMTGLVIVVLLVNIAGCAVWDVFVSATRFSNLQWAAVVLGTASLILFEAGRQ